MPKSTRRYIFIAVAWLALSGQRDEPSTEAAQARAQQSIANSLATMSSTSAEANARSKVPPPAEPCGPNHYGSNSELCAAWKAADAAGDGVKWSMIGAAVSIFGVIFALMISLRANGIAQKAFELERRPWLFVSGVSIDQVRFEDDVDGKRLAIPEATIEVTNCGGSPARDVVVTAQFKQLFPGEPPQDQKTYSVYIQYDMIPAGDKPEKPSFSILEINRDELDQNSLVHFELVTAITYKSFLDYEERKTVQTWSICREIFRGTPQGFIWPDIAA